MLLSRVALRLLVMVLTLSLCAAADSIPYRDRAVQQSIQFPRLYSAGLPSIGLLLDSAIALQTHNLRPRKGLILVYVDPDAAHASVRNTNFLEWIFTIIVKLVLPNHGRQTKKYADLRK